MAFGDVVRSAASPSTVPWGIGGKSSVIWHCDSGALDRIYELSIVDFSVVRFAASPSFKPYGIGGDGAAIWHCDPGDPDPSRVFELSTVDFSVVRSADSPSSNPYGIGGNDTTIWHCDVWTDLIYELALAVIAPTVTTDPASAISQVSSTLKGTLDNDGGEACQVRFQYGLTDAYGTDTEWQPGKETDDTFEQAISGLDPNTTYHFRAQAKNSAGTTSGADRTFTTQVAVIVNKAYALAREEL